MTPRDPHQITEHPDLDAVKRMRIELGTTPVEFAAERLEDVRPELREAMKELDCTEHRDLHVRLAGLISEIDDLRAVMAERWAS